MAAGELPGVYKVPAYRARGRAIATNKAPTAPYRGVSRPQLVLVNASAARFNFDGDSRGAGVDTVLDEFLGHRSGSFNNLTCCDLISYVICEDTDFGHTQKGTLCLLLCILSVAKLKLVQKQKTNDKAPGSEFNYLMLITPQIDRVKDPLDHIRSVAGQQRSDVDVAFL